MKELFGRFLADPSGRCPLRLSYVHFKDCILHVSAFPPWKHLMLLNTRSHQSLTRSLAIAAAVACGFSLSSAAQAQMVAGSGCTNCGGASNSVVTYSQPMASQNYTPASHPSQAAYTQSYPSSSYSGCSSTRQRCSSSHRSVVRHRHTNNSCGGRFSNASVHSSGCGQSSGCGGSGNVSYPADDSYTVSNSYSGGSVMQVSTPVMQTGAGCPGGNCR